jgi:hypothetical protein
LRAILLDPDGGVTVAIALAIAANHFQPKPLLGKALESVLIL